jgi:hypothetical protein
LEPSVNAVIAHVEASTGTHQPAVADKGPDASSVRQQVQQEKGAGK